MKTPCLECDGSGVVVCDCDADCGCENPCPACDGTGELESVDNAEPGPV